ncbi:phosphatase PAP2 family protein [Candidatus Tisiphia endosymbiont of Nemotelus uliginosus]|uniref:phosphatase PAP2 family protein n=1 Tax=Candidatus Tisiphia endosymbiont of Nemotelus uliginosus TaxID=3077926 RepID=UPI0035C8E841
MFEFVYHFLGLNQELFLYLNKVTNHFNIIAYILQIISDCFNISNFAVAYFICCIYFCITLNKIQDFEQFYIKFWPIYNKLFLLGIIYTIFGLTYAILKFSVNMPRPFCSLPAYSFTTIADVSLARCLSSFPSSHVGLALVVAYSIWTNITITQKLFTFLVVLLVALSRIALAMHYPADIIYSFVITILIIIISKVVFRIFSNNLIKWIGQIIVKKLYR